MGKKTKTPVLNSEAIKAMWDAEKEGKPITAPAVLVQQAAEAVSLKQQVEELKEKAEKPKALTGQLRQALNDILQKHKITAAFEPLVALALEVYPPGHQYQGQFVCTVDQRIRIWVELLQYQMPKLRAIEVSGEVDNTLNIVIRKFADNTVAVEQTITQGRPVYDVPAEVTQDEGPSIKIKKF